jgi:hypothetical protein
MVKRISFPLVLAATVCFVAGCASEGFTSVKDYDMVLTIEDPIYDYRQNSTYVVIPEVEVLSDFVDEGIEIEDKERWQNVIIPALHQNMKARGYTEWTGDPQDADVVVGAGIVAVENWSYYSYYPWWGWYGWYYYPYYGPTVAVNYSSGSVLIVMIDPEKTTIPDTDVPIPPHDTDMELDAGVDGGVPTPPDGEVYQAIWGAGLHGLLNYVTEQKVRNGINQAFEQSPYLTLGGAQ